MKRSANYIISFAASYQTHIARSAKKKQPVHCTYAISALSAWGGGSQSHDFQAKFGENPTILSTTGSGPAAAEVKIPQRIKKNKNRNRR